MCIYLDLLFLLNTAVNYLLLRGSAAMGGCAAPPLRTLAAAGIGGGYAALSVLPGLTLLQALPFQLLCAVLMALCAFGCIKSTIRQSLLFLALSFALGGAVLLAVQAAETDLLMLGGRAYYAVSTPALLLLAGLCYGLAAVILSGCGFHRGGDIHTITMELQQRRVTVRALRDTGNTLRDPVTGQPVLVADWQCLARLLPEAGLTRQAFGQPAALMAQLSHSYPQCRFRLIPYRAIGVDSGLLLAVPCRIGGTKGLAAFTPTEVSPEGQFDALTGGIVS